MQLAGDVVLLLAQVAEPDAVDVDRVDVDQRVGDPLADVGMLFVYWAQPGDQLTALMQPPTLASGFPNRDELMDRYAERSGRDLSELDFYIALARWKLAIILEGVYSRYAAGQYGKTDQGIDEFAKGVEDLANAAAEAEARLG